MPVQPNFGSNARALAKAAKVFEKYYKAISGTFSARMPASTRITVGSGGVQLVAEGAIAPNAAEFELGELHPLWARKGTPRYRWKWGKQPHRPVMLEAAEAGADEALEVYAQTVIDHALQLGWKLGP